MNSEKLDTIIPMRMDGLTLLALHGACCLGLRHPEFKGPSRNIVLKFVNMAEGRLIGIGALSKEDVRQIHRVENKRSKHRD